MGSIATKMLQIINRTWHSLYIFAVETKRKVRSTKIFQIFTGFFSKLKQKESRNIVLFSFAMTFIMDGPFLL